MRLRYTEGRHSMTSFVYLLHPKNSKIRPYIVYTTSEQAARNSGRSRDLQRLLIRPGFGRLPFILDDNHDSFSVKNAECFKLEEGKDYAVIEKLVEANGTHYIQVKLNLSSIMAKPNLKKMGKIKDSHVLASDHPCRLESLLPSKKHTRCMFAK